MKSTARLVQSCRDKWQKVWIGGLLRSLEDEEVKKDTIVFLDQKISELEHKLNYYKNVKDELQKA